MFATASFLILSSRLSFFDEYYQNFPKVSNIEYNKTFFFIIGFFVTAIYLPIENEVLKYRLRGREKDAVLEQQLRDFYETNCNYLADIFDLKAFGEVSFRIYLPEKNWGYFRFLIADWYARFVNNKKRQEPSNKELVTFKYHEIKNLCVKLIDDELSFVVNPQEKGQGMVGLAYSECGIGIKNPSNDIGNEVVNIEENGYGAFEENLTSYQSVVLSQFPFTMTIPVISTSSKIKAIIGVDSTKDFTVQEDLSVKQINQLKMFGRSFMKELKPLLKKKLYLNI
ncbi:MAG: hypothetical protein R8G66_19595 [Cytophagales bacterium]|nr:hypothetical protein [Cytophagales bacterium]